MDILFYKLKDKINDVKKTATLTAIGDSYPLTVSGTLKNATSKVNPVIEFAKDITYFNGYNYCYIADFNRYYFVSDVVSVRVGLTSISFRVDVLTSFLTLQGTDNLLGYVIRCNNSSLYDLTIEDKMLQVKSKPLIIEEDTISLRPVSHYINTSFTTKQSSHFYNTVVDIVGHATGGSGTPMSNITVPDYLKASLATSYFYNDYDTLNVNNFYPYEGEHLYLMDVNEVNAMCVKAVPNPHNFYDYVKSIVMFPYEIFDASNNTSYPKYDINYGDNYELTGASATVLPTHSKGIITVDDFYCRNLSNIDGDSFLSSNSHLRIEYYVPYYGWVTLNANSVYGHRLILYYIVNYRTGSALANIFDYTDKKLIFSSMCQLGYKFAISPTNAWEVAQKQSAYDTNYILGTLTSIGIGVAGGIMGNPYMVVGGISGVVSSASSYVSQTTTNFERAHANIGDDSISSFTPQKPRVRFTVDVVVQKNTDTPFKEHNGIPTNKQTTLGAIRVTNSNIYAQILDLDIEDNGSYLGDITYPEADELKRLCAEGIYL